MSIFQHFYINFFLIIVMGLWVFDNVNDPDGLLMILDGFDDLDGLLMGLMAF